MRQPLPCHEKLLVTTFATALLAGCGAQPAQEPAAQSPVTPPETVTLAPVQPEPVPEATPPKSTAQSPAQPALEVQPVEPAAPEAKPAKWEAATGGNWDAATRGNTKLIKRLLADGMDVDVTDKGG